MNKFEGKSSAYRLNLKKEKKTKWLQDKPKIYNYIFKKKKRQFCLL